MDSVTLRHPDTNGTQRVSDSPDVVDHFKARGWVVVDDAPDPDDPRNISVPVSADAPGEEWVEMTHPDLPHAQPHRVPNHPDAIAGLRESGWVLATPAEDEASETAPVKRRKQTPAEAGKDTDAAGDGAHEKE